MSDLSIIYQYDPRPVEPFVKEGVTDVWLVSWRGEPGPAQTLKMVALADSEGIVSFVPTGEWENVTVVDESPA